MLMLVHLSIITTIKINGRTAEQTTTAEAKNEKLTKTAPVKAIPINHLVTIPRKNWTSFTTTRSTLTSEQHE